MTSGAATFDPVLQRHRRRALPRIPLFTDVLLLLPGWEQVDGVTHDLTRAGACIAAANVGWHEGLLLGIELRFPEALGALCLRGRVMWSRNELAGICFLDVSVGDALFIQRAIDDTLAELASFEGLKTPIYEHVALEGET